MKYARAASLAFALLLTWSVTGAHASTSHANRTCGVLKTLHNTLTKLDQLVHQAPTLSVKHAKSQTDALKYRQMGLEIGNPVQVAPKSVDRAITDTIATLRKAVLERTHHDMHGYSRDVRSAQAHMRSAWSSFFRFRGGKRCG